SGVERLIALVCDLIANGFQSGVTSRPIQSSESGRSHMQPKHVRCGSKTTRRMTARIATYKGMCVLGISLLGHTALSAPPAEGSDDASPAASAPAIDRVGFPEDYQARFKVLSVKVKDDGLQVLTVYG